MKRKRHTPVAEGFSMGVQIIRKQRTAALRSQSQSVADLTAAGVAQRQCRALAV